MDAEINKKTSARKSFSGGHKAAQLELLVNELIKELKDENNLELMKKIEILWLTAE